MVNDGPERDGPERDGSERDGPQERGPEKSGSQERGSESASQVNPGAGDGADMDEVALRRMLHGAVEHIEPGDGTLDLLQRAVPARRARRRQAAVGMAAAALLIGTAVPAFVHVANSDGSNAANPAIAGHGEQAQGGNGTERDSGTGGKSDGGGSDGPADGGPNRPASTGSPSDGRGQDTDGGLAAWGRRPDRVRGGVPAGLRPGAALGRLGRDGRGECRRHGVRHLPDRQRLRHGLFGEQQRKRGLSGDGCGRPGRYHGCPAHGG